MGVLPGEGEGAAESATVQRLLASAPKSVVFLPLYGEAAAQPLCFVLRVEGVTCLLDCGWSEACDLELLRPLALIAPYVDLVRVGGLRVWVEGSGLLRSHAVCAITPRPLERSNVRLATPAHSHHRRAHSPLAT